ncbi:MAG: 3-coathanger stack domain-containing protein, partial [Saprospiraceae bacterium]
LEEVVEHYNSGVKAHPNLNSSLKDEDGSPQQLGLTEQEKTDVVNFLKTLTDETMINDDKFSDPFIRDQCQTEIVCNDNLTGTNTISAAEYITANGTIATGSAIIFEAGDSIVLKPGFSVAAGAIFTAQIKDCMENELVETSLKQRNTLITQTNLVASPQKEMELVIQPNPSFGSARILFELSKSSPVTVHLFDHSGKLLKELLVSKTLSTGRHELQLLGGDLYIGLFYVVIKTPTLTMTQKMIVVK